MEIVVLIKQNERKKYFFFNSRIHSKDLSRFSLHGTRSTSRGIRIQLVAVFEVEL